MDDAVDDAVDVGARRAESLMGHDLAHASVKASILFLVARFCCFAS
jgi:hypothetical protein